MQDAGYGLPRTPLLGTWVNSGFTAAASPLGKMLRGAGTSAWFAPTPGGALPAPLNTSLDAQQDQPRTPGGVSLLLLERCYVLRTSENTLWGNVG